MRDSDLLWETVTDGQELPPFDYELSQLRLVSFVRATGLYDYVHFDTDYARAVGAEDAFIATPHAVGLFCRLITDWTGPGASIRNLTINMHKSCFRNDMLSVGGRVARKYVDDAGRHLVHLAGLAITCEGRGPAMTADAIVELKSGSTEPATQWDPLDTRPVVDETTPDFAKAVLGVRSSRENTYSHAVSENEILLWCESLEDWNPLYCDADFAKASRFGGIVAPPAATGMFFSPKSLAPIGIGYLRPGAEIPEAVSQGLRGVPLLKELRKNFGSGSVALPIEGYSELIVVKAEYNFVAPMRPGDRIRQERALMSCSALRKTRLGEGYFVQSAAQVFNHRDELLSQVVYTILHYRPDA